MKKYYLKKLIFLFSVSLLSSLFLGCSREIAMPIIGNIDKTNVDKTNDDKNLETEINAKTASKNSEIETSKEKINDFNDMEETSSVKKETSSVKSESITLESTTPKQINNEESFNNNENNANLKSRALRDNEDSNNTLFNIKIPTNNDTLTENKIGYIYNIKYSNNTYYLEFDDVEIFLGDEAKREFLADGNSEESQDIENGYYIKDSNNDLKKYILTENCTYELCKYQIDSSTNDIALVSVDFKTLKNYILKYIEFYPTRALLFDINIENNIETKVSMHFTP